MGKMITNEGIQKLDQEKVALNLKLPLLREVIKDALRQGDTVENSDYTQAIEEKERITARLEQIDKMLATATIVDNDKEDGKASIGDTVQIKFCGTDEVEDFKLCTSVEADPMENLVSIESPFGESLYKRKVGDIVSVSSPSGDYKVEILAIS